MFNNKFMHSALAMAEKAFIAEEIPVGAVIIDPSKNNIIASAYNLVEARCDPTAHAEILAIQSACQAIANKSLSGLDLYITLQPCAMCMQAIIYAKITRVYFGAYNPTSSINLSSVNHKPEIYGGIEEEKCRLLLNKFFTNVRT